MSSKKKNSNPVQVLIVSVGRVSRLLSDVAQHANIGTVSCVLSIDEARNMLPRMPDDACIICDRDSLPDADIRAFLKDVRARDSKKKNFGTHNVRTFIGTWRGSFSEKDYLEWARMDVSMQFYTVQPNVNKKIVSSLKNHVKMYGAEYIPYSPPTYAGVQKLAQAS